MSVTFEVGRETIIERPGMKIVLWSELSPYGFDPKQEIGRDEYGPVFAENPWSLNLANDNAVRVLKLLGQDSHSELGHAGTLYDLSEFIARCDNALGALKSFPTLDSGIAASESCSERIIDCGVRPGAYGDWISKLRELAQIALEHRGVLRFV